MPRLRGKDATSLPSNVPNYFLMCVDHKRVVLYVQSLGQRNGRRQSGELPRSGRTNMAVRIELPEDIEHHLEKQWGDLPRHALESLAIEGYRARVLSRSQVRR